MSERHDAWRDTYDAWKLATPPEYDYDEECDHDDYELDVLDGTATCSRCGHVWEMTRENMERHHRRLRAHDAWVAKQRRIERWDNFKRPFARLWFGLWFRLFGRRHPDDEIPF